MERQIERSRLSDGAKKSVKPNRKNSSGYFVSHPGNLSTKRRTPTLTVPTRVAVDLEDYCGTKPTSLSVAERFRLAQFIQRREGWKVVRTAGACIIVTNDGSADALADKQKRSDDCSNNLLSNVSLVFEEFHVEELLDFVVSDTNNDQKDAFLSGVWDIANS